MRTIGDISMIRGCLLAGVFAAMCEIEPVLAQEVPRRVQINISRASGGTPYSFGVEAEAKLVEAQGSFLESAATARKINADAVAKEIENSVAFVKAYFDRREENRKRRLEEAGGNLQDHLATAEEAEKKRITTLFQNTLKGDVTSDLNWLLRELSGPTMAVHYMSRETLADFDVALSPQDLEQIRLTDGARGNSKIVVTADDGTPLKTQWPFALKGAEFDSARKEFEAARDRVVQEIQTNGRAGGESGTRLLKATDQLMTTLDTVYSEQERMKQDVFMRYNSGKIFLKNLVAQVTRAITSNDRQVFDGSLQFKGKTMVDLIQHMCQTGLLFDRPQEDGNRVYAGLFAKMRNLYITLAPDNNVGGDARARN
jgi:hypothetical protein